MTHHHLRFTPHAPRVGEPPIISIDHDWRDAEGIYAEEPNASLSVRTSGYSGASLWIFPHACPECSRALIVGMQAYERLYNDYVRKQLEMAGLETAGGEDIPVQMGEK